MCGRYNLLPNAAVWLDAFTSAHNIINEIGFAASYNIVPSNLVPIIRKIENSLHLNNAHWGFIPHWVKDLKPKIQPANARADTVATKPFFREAFKQRRCVFPASGFFEWQTSGSNKQPYNITMEDGQPFLMAGIWDNWYGQDRACVLTTEANELMAPIHDRMVVIIPPDQVEEWIEGRHPETFLKPFPAEKMRAVKVSKALNRPENNSPDLLDPID